MMFGSGLLFIAVQSAVMRRFSSVVVRADRPGFLRRMIASGVLPLAADATGCGSTEGRGR